MAGCGMTNAHIPSTPLSHDSGDHTCDASDAKAIYDACSDHVPSLPRAYRNVEGWSHLEPVLTSRKWENPLLATVLVGLEDARTGPHHLTYRHTYRHRLMHHP